MEVVARFIERSEADVAESLLDAAGIPVLLADEEMTRNAWLYSIALGGTRLIVPDDRADEARSILEECGEIQHGDDESPSAGLPEEDACPRCRSGMTRYSGRDRRLRALSMLFLWFNVPVLFWGKRLMCEECGHEWRPGRLPG
jgi:hypothetical protein